MARIIIRPETAVGKIKPMHCVNNGPIKARSDQVRENFGVYQAARIPYMRNHDASFCAGYGGEHTVDVHLIFPDFSKDENDPASYDFWLTDEYLAKTLAAGTKIFYRLGSKIEHETKKYGTLPPPDYEKWARICEHIIRHYNEGWADGKFWNIEYWEIWNEPDLNADNPDPVLRKTWGGSTEEFFRFFETAAKHLKTCFPNLKIGGPALCTSPSEWMLRFVTYLKEHKVPLDFLSWHNYNTTPGTICFDSDATRRILDESGYAGAESICNEWNYVLNWDTQFIDSIETIIGLKGASFIAACMLFGQNKPIDMMMYYDARPSVFNGMFDFYSLRPLKGYYPFPMFADLFELGTQVSAESDDRDIYAVCAGQGDKLALMLTYYSDKAEAEKQLMVEGLQDGMRVFAVDEDHNCECLPVQIRQGKLSINIKPFTILLIK